MNIADTIDRAGQIAAESLGRNEWSGDDSVWDMITKDEFAFDVAEHVENTGTLPTASELAEWLVSEIRSLD